jgi:hypothetical protein
MGGTLRLSSYPHAVPACRVTHPADAGLADASSSADVQPWLVGGAVLERGWNVSIWWVTSGWWVRNVSLLTRSARKGTYCKTGHMVIKHSVLQRDTTTMYLQEFDSHATMRLPRSTHPCWGGHSGQYGSGQTQSICTVTDGFMADIDVDVQLSCINVFLHCSTQLLHRPRAPSSCCFESRS